MSPSPPGGGKCWLFAGGLHNGREVGRLQGGAPILAKLEGLEEQLVYVEFSCRQGPDYQLYLNSPFRLDFPPEQLAALVAPPEAEALELA